MPKERPTTIPFDAQELVLKQIRFDALTPIEQVNLEFFFPGYGPGGGFSKATPRPGSPLDSFAKNGGNIVHDDHMPRRYAGDFSLPRSRYYTVCRDASGDDLGTLVNELRAYGKPAESGYTVVVDSTGSDPSAIKVRSLLAPGTQAAIVCMPRDTAKFPTPYPLATGIDRKQHGQLAALIPVVTKREYVDRVIDLRKPNVQAWLTRELTTLTEPTSNTLSFPLAPPLTDFTKLLPTLLSQGLGDRRSVTQAAGLWLRRIGANALIFPSARKNVFVDIRNDRLVDWGGWNLVDYRDAPPAIYQGHIDTSPEWDRYPTYGHRDLTGASADEGQPLRYENVRISRVDSGVNEGSLRVEGLEETREQLMGFQVWLYFVAQVRQRYPFIDADRLVHASYTLGAKGKSVDIAELSNLAQLFCFAIFGEDEEKARLRQLATHFMDSGNHQTASAIINLLTVCA